MRSKFLTTLILVVGTLLILQSPLLAKDDKKSLPKTGTAVGNKAPEIIEKDVTREKSIKLSSLRGKLVLIDFWASWCGPCRRENPNVVLAYQKYKDTQFINGKGFTVYSVSLDKNQSAWQKGIEEDKLEWPYHVSDLKGWYSKYASVYGVRGIPTNFLIDGRGVIIAKNLKGESLHKVLEELKKQ